MISKILNLWYISGSAVILKAYIDKSREEIYEKIDRPEEFWHFIAKDLIADFINIFSNPSDILNGGKPRKIFLAQGAAGRGAVKTLLRANDIFEQGSRDEKVFFDIIFNAFNNLSIEIGSNLNLLPISNKESIILEISAKSSEHINLNMQKS